MPVSTIAFKYEYDDYIRADIINISDDIGGDIDDNSNNHVATTPNRNHHISTTTNYS